MQGRFRIAAIVALFAAMLAGCGKSGSIDDLNTTIVSLPDGAQIRAETMMRDVDLQRGMMFRDSLAADRGMLFIHAKDGNYAHWMYNCRIPLDIIWLDRQQRVVEMVANAPPCTSQSANDCPTYGGKQTSRYVVELNAGAAAAHGIREGDKLAF
jgi:uncharacterized membrane protein (UPF0127 family)